MSDTNKMKAVWYEIQGEADDVLIYGDLDRPEPQAGEVLIKLYASSINPSDTNRRAGRGYDMTEPMIIPHSDGAGIIEAVGEGVDASRVGERVWLYNGQRGRDFGTAAEYIALDASLATTLPDNTTFAEGASLGIPGMTAYHCVMSDGPVAGKTILVQGAAGAVGNYAVQFAKRAGARVIGTVDTDWKAEDARRAGADELIRWDSEDVAERVLELTDGKGVDRIVEVDFGGNIETSLKITAPNAVVIGYASRGNPTPTVPFYVMLRKNLTLRAVFLPGTPVEKRVEAQTEVTKFLAEGNAFHRVEETYDLDKSAEAHKSVETGTKRGTVVVCPHREGQ